MIVDETKRVIETDDSEEEKPEEPKRKAIKKMKVDFSAKDKDIVATSEAISSQNFYSEILFDYLLLFYKKDLIIQAKTYQKLMKIQRRIDAGKYDRKTGDKFEKYYKSIVKRKNLQETLINHYHNTLLGKHKKNAGQNQVEDIQEPGENPVPQNSASPPSGEAVKKVNKA